MESKTSSLRQLILAFIAVAVIVGGVLWVFNLSSSNTTQNPALSPETAEPSDDSKITNYNIKVAYIAVNDNGASGEPIGCGDSVVLVDKTVRATSSTQGALQALLAEKREHYGESGLYNAVWQSTLTIDSITTVNAVATVRLSGNLKLSGECDSPRVKAQLESTIKASSGATTVNVFINGKTLDEALSLK